MQTSKHILQSFGSALDDLRASVLMMASLTERNLTNAMGCLLKNDDDLCAVTIADEEEIDALEKQIDADGIDILRRFQPVASDLRQVISGMKVGSNLERVADQATNIARKARKISPDIPRQEFDLIEPIFREAIQLLQDTIRAYAESDPELARSLRARDEVIDNLSHTIADRLTSEISQMPDRATDLLNLIFIARHIERVGDHAKNIAEDTVYSAAAEDIRHPDNRFAVSQ